MNILSSNGVDLNKKIDTLLHLFPTSASEQDKYQKIIELGQSLALFDDRLKVESNLVYGCQSTVYLASELKQDHTMIFSAHSEALISAGLAALCIFFYSHLSPEEVLKTPPFFIEKLALTKSLTPGRSNGLLGIINKIKQSALFHCINYK